MSDFRNVGVGALVVVSWSQPLALVRLVRLADKSWQKQG